MIHATICVCVDEIKLSHNGTTSVAVAETSFCHTSREGECNHLNITVRGYGANGNLLGCLEPGTIILVGGSLWIGKTNILEADTIMLVSGEVYINTVMLIGRQGKQPDVRHFESGTILSSTSICITKNKSESYWYNIQCWGKTAETLANFGRKGEMIGFKGSLEINSYIDKSGNPIKCLRVNANSIALLSNKSEQKVAEAVNVPY